MTLTAPPHLQPSSPDDAQPASGTVLRLARWSTKHRTKALIGWFLFVAVVFVGGNLAGTRLLEGAQTGTGESGRADRIVEQAGYPATPTERILVQARSGSLDAATATAVGNELRGRLSGMKQVGEVGELIRSQDGRSALLPVVLDVNGKTGNAAYDVAGDQVPAVLAVTADVAKAHPDLKIAQAGDASLDKAIGGQVSKDFSRAEKLSLPVTLAILILSFGALIAAGVPVILALSAVMAGIGLSSLVSHVVPVMDSLNSVILLIGMAVGVDYSLFYVRRAREERARGASRRSSVEIAAQTSGRAVVVSGLAVFIAMSGLLLSGDATFVSMAVGTMLVVAVAVLGSLTALPAMLSAFGDKVDRPRIPFVHRLRRADGEGRFWPAVMRVVLHRPAISLLLAGTAMVALALPALGMRTGEAGADSLPRSIPIMKTYDAMTAAFPQTGFAHTVVVHSGSARIDQAALDAGVTRLVADAKATGQFTGLDDVQPNIAPDGRTATIDVPMTGDFSSKAAGRSLTTLRERLVPTLSAGLPGTQVMVTGPTAGSTDFAASMRSHLPWVMGFVLGLTFVVLVFAFRSVVVAATAVVLNLLSVGAAYGLMVLVFQHGIGAGALGLAQTGFIVDWLPLFLFVVLFGLSMDYHVFVVSRIREQHDSGLPTKLAVARGVTSSAGVVTSAAAVMVGVFSIFGTLSLLEFKQLGVGLAAAVLIDATIVRAVLLPSAMTLLGHKNWWLPAALERRLPAQSH
ncbi:MMPL family transporter [Angustibacter sp. McL0619]|uniref:MMPL family transporter n=1 Tax=Angustibacter sp. McL0619 TaxID=3415676 RepID=UPI003CE8D981